MKGEWKEVDETIALEEFNKYKHVLVLYTGLAQNLMQLKEGAPTQDKLPHHFMNKYWEREIEPEKFFIWEE